jgi:hypothetical protein
MAKSAAIRSFREFPHRTIAIVYDFDGTLSPLSMQEYTIFPELKIDPKVFWPEVKRVTKENEASEVLTYMRLLADRIVQANVAINKTKLGSLGSKIEYFPGVDSWFDRMDKFVKEQTLGYVKLQHYIVSSGLREILQGTSIAKHFEAIFASQYSFDPFGRPVFVDRVITDVSKTQYLFRINKGVLNLSDSVNDHMPEDQRPIPFSNMIYIGDGDTDVPSMAVTRKNGGHAFAVHSPGESASKCELLFRANRVDAYFEADYSTNSRLEIFVKNLLKKLIGDIRYRSMLHVFKSEVVGKSELAT